MDFDLKKPCPHCPFRNDIKPYLSRDRVEELQSALESGRTFTCHKTTVAGDEDEMVDGPNAQHCAGALILMEKDTDGDPGCMAIQLARIAGRFGLFDPKKLDMDSPVFDSWNDMIEAQER